MFSAGAPLGPVVGGLLLEHFFKQVVQHKSMAAGERLDKTCGV